MARSVPIYYEGFRYRRPEKKRVSGLRLWPLLFLLFGGCAAIPDSVNYTASFDRRGGQFMHYVGASWQVPKPGGDK